MAMPRKYQEAIKALRRRGLSVTLCLSRGQCVTYTGAAGQTIRAIVRRRHTDESVTVEAQFELRDGKVHGCYLGYPFRLDLRDLTPED